MNEFGAVGISVVQSCNVKMVCNVISLGDICALNEGLLWLFTADFHLNSPLILTVVMYCSVYDHLFCCVCDEDGVGLRV